MIVAARIAGLLAVVAMGLAAGLQYDFSIVRSVAQFWLPISAVLAFAVVFCGAPSNFRALTRYETSPPAISGARIFVGVVGAALATTASNFLLLLGILVR